MMASDEDTIKEVMRVLDKRCVNKLHKLQIMTLVNKMYMLRLMSSKDKGSRLD